MGTDIVFNAEMCSVLSKTVNAPPTGPNWNFASDVRTPTANFSQPSTSTPTTLVCTFKAFVSCRSLIGLRFQSPLRTLRGSEEDSPGGTREHRRVRVSVDHESRRFNSHETFMTAQQYPRRFPLAIDTCRRQAVLGQEKRELVVAVLSPVQSVRLPHNPTRGPSHRVGIKCQARR